MSAEIPFVEMTEINREMLKRYAHASGDHNPIHLDDDVAKKMGLPSVIAHGMLVAGILTERVLRFLNETGRSSFKKRKFDCRFKNMTFPGDRVSVGGVVKNETETSLLLEVQAKNDKGLVLVLGHFEFENKNAK